MKSYSNSNVIWLVTEFFMRIVALKKFRRYGYA